MRLAVALAGLTAGFCCAPSATAQIQLEQIAQDTRPIQIGQFSEPVDLGSFVEFVARALEVNIVLANVDLSGRTVEFKASMTVEYRELIPLLDTLLAQQGFGLSQTEEGWLMVSSAGNLLPDFEGTLATTRLFPTPLAKPSAILNALNAVMGSAAGGGAANRLTAIDELGVIVSTAPPRVNRAIEGAIDRIMQEHNDQHTVPMLLEHIAAVEARERVLQLVGQSRQTGAPRGAGAPAATAALTAQGFSNLAERLFADRSSNALLFRGTDEEAQELRVLIAIVDRPSRIVIRRYNAGAMSPVIAGYGERQGLGPVVRAGNTSGSDSQFFGSGFMVESTDVGAFTYYGTAAQHDRVEDLVEEFADQVRDEQMVVVFYKMQNADAEEAAELINQLLELEDTDDRVAQSPFLQSSVERNPQNVSRISDFGAAPPPNQPLVQGEGVTTTTPVDGGGFGGLGGTDGDGELGLTPTEGMSIIADAERNQLIVRAPVRQQKEIKRVVDEIDQRRPQVYLEVQIVTVSASNDFRITVETALTDPGSGTGRIPVFTNFGLLTDPNNVNSVRIPFADGFTSAIINDDWVPLIINALQSEGNGKVLSTPRMLVNDNETATLNSTENISFAQTTQTVGAPTQTSLGGQISAGTTLTVTPQISEGGFVIIDLDITLSAFGDQPNPDLPPNTRSDSVQTVITVPADSTVVVGGLSFQAETDSVSKIPLLGDIPILGHLFRSQTKKSQESTLYIFITPRILRDPTFADLRLLTRGPSEKMEIDLGGPPSLEPAIMSIVETTLEISQAREEAAQADRSGAM